MSDYELYVRWSDVDAYGHVNNVKYFEYFQEARLALLGPLWRESDGAGAHLVVAAMDVDYKRPILFRLEPYVVRSHVARIGRTSFSIAAEIRDPTQDDALLSRSEGVLVAVGRDGAATPISDSWREVLAAASA